MKDMVHIVNTCVDNESYACELNNMFVSCRVHLRSSKAKESNSCSITMHSAPQPMHVSVQQPGTLHVGPLNPGQWQVLLAIQTPLAQTGLHTTDHEERERKEEHIHAYNHAHLQYPVHIHICTYCMHA